MRYDTMFAKVSGTTCEGEKFTERLTFHLIPPDEGQAHYGTGYYMRVTGKGLPWGRQLEDVRYAKTTDIEILADRWIAGWYGKNAEDVIKQFPVEGQTEFSEATMPRIDPDDLDSMIRIMDEYGESRFPYSGKNEAGEDILASVFQDKVVVSTNQENGWVRVNAYWRDGTREEYFDGR